MAEKVKVPPRDFGAVWNDAVDACIAVAERDLLDQPGLVAAERRFDGGASEATAKRIAEKLRALKVQS